MKREIAPHKSLPTARSSVPQLTLRFKLISSKIRTADKGGKASSRKQGIKHKPQSRRIDAPKSLRFDQGQVYRFPYGENARARKKFDSNMQNSSQLSNWEPGVSRVRDWLDPKRSIDSTRSIPTAPLHLSAPCKQRRGGWGAGSKQTCHAKTNDFTNSDEGALSNATYSSQILSRDSFSGLVTVKGNCFGEVVAHSRRGKLSSQVVVDYGVSGP